MPSEAWTEYCDLLKSAGDIMLRHTAPDDSLERAEGFRYLSRLSRAALELCLENQDPLWPQLLEKPYLLTWGFTNPDQILHRATVSGRYTYRIWGTRGEAAYFSLNTYSGTYAQGGQSGGRDGHLDHHKIEVGAG